ncbi:TrkA family potassium uptake protein [Streptomyces sp. JJ36]|uniref:potassium channel family protein n=1 Tax=Streptomyces sp. JJ36 TaxID=2736645 RepID=UPI0027E42537|nr:TrkA family potassium uptake protein [Streptomyces sp. JJ36]
MIIAGCGRVGATLAARLSAERHDVRVVDPQPEARETLPAAYTGRFLVGDAAGAALLREAGVEHASAFVAATSGDTTNLALAREAKETHRVPTVVARINDPSGTELYHGLGIHTVAGVHWTVFQIHQMLLHRHLTPELTFGNGETLLVRSELPAYLTGRRLAAFDVDGEIRVVEVTREGRSHVPAHNTTIHAGDLVTFAVAATALHRLQSFLDRQLGT